jgi:hypothetical protein
MFNKIKSFCISIVTGIFAVVAVMICNLIYISWIGY